MSWSTIASGRARRGSSSRASRTMAGSRRTTPTARAVRAWIFGSGRNTRHSRHAAHSSSPLAPRGLALQPGPRGRAMRSANIFPRRRVKRAHVTQRRVARARRIAFAHLEIAEQRRRPVASGTLLDVELAADDGSHAVTDADRRAAHTFSRHLDSP